MRSPNLARVTEFEIGRSLPPVPPTHLCLANYVMVVTFGVVFGFTHCLYVVFMSSLEKTNIVVRDMSLYSR